MENVLIVQRNLIYRSDKMIKIYSLPVCPKCDLIKAKMKNKNIPFEEITDQDIMKEKGFLLLPVLETEERIITSFSEINKYINNR